MFRRELFWDVDFDRIDWSAKRKFVIERILRFGFPEDVAELLAYYADDDVIATIKTSRGLDRKSAGFWALHYDIPREEVLCLRRQYQMKWPD